MLRFLPVMSLVFFGVMGCRSVQPRDLAGTWTIEDASRKSLPAVLQNVSAKILLDSNGTFVASDMPGLFSFHGRRPAQPETGSGTWKLMTREGKQRVQLDFLVIVGWKQPLPYGTQLDVSNGTLFYFLGDADEGRKIAFEKK